MTKPETKIHKPGCLINTSCLVYHPDGVCPGPYGQCKCDSKPEPNTNLAWIKGMEKATGKEFSSKPWQEKFDKLFSPVYTDDFDAMWPIKAFISQTISEAVKAREEEIKRMLENMKIGKDKEKIKVLEDKIGQFGCCGEEISGYDQALSDLLEKLK